MSQSVAIRLTVNGEPFEGRCEPRKLLVDFLREDLGLTGTHVGCEHGVCGACTIHFNGKSARSCIMLAVQADGAALHTIEGLATDGAFHPLQQAFHENHGLQCGFCTPGMLMVALDFLRAQSATDRDGNSRGDLGGPLPLHRLSRHRPLDRSGGRDHAQKWWRNGLMAEPAGTPFIGRPLLRREDRRLLTRAGPVRCRSRAAAHAACGVCAQPHGACAHPLGRSARAAAVPGVAYVLNGADLVQLLPPVPEGQISLPSKWAPRWSSTNSSIRSSRCSRTTRCGMSARRSRSSSPRAATRPRTRRALVEAAISRSCRQWSIPRRRSRPAAPIVHEQFGTNLIGEFAVGQGRCRRRPAPRAAPAAAPLPPSPLCRAADGMPRRGQRLRRAHAIR